MLINNEKLKEIILQVGKEQFKGREFRRRPAMAAVENCIRKMGAWTADDEDISGSRGLKSKGLALIDWRISDLKQEGRLLNIGRDRWRLPGGIENAKK